MGNEASEPNADHERALAVIRHLAGAVDAHDLDAVEGCFSAGYVNETPVHPSRSFTGREQVRRNWSAIFQAVPDVRATVRCAVDGDTVWSEWEMSGTRRDGGLHLMRGVVIFTVGAEEITRARFYLEPVEQEGGEDADQAVRRITHQAPPASSAGTS